MQGVNNFSHCPTFSQQPNRPSRKNETPKHQILMTKTEYIDTQMKQNQGEAKRRRTDLDSELCACRWWRPLVPSPKTTPFRRRRRKWEVPLCQKTASVHCPHHHRRRKLEVIWVQKRAGRRSWSWFASSKRRRFVRPFLLSVPRKLSTSPVRTFQCVCFLLEPKYLEGNTFLIILFFFKLPCNLLRALFNLPIPNSIIQYFRGCLAVEMGTAKRHRIPSLPNSDASINFTKVGNKSKMIMKYIKFQVGLNLLQLDDIPIHSYHEII